MTLTARFLATTFASMLAVSVGTGALAAVLFLCATGPAHASGGHDHSPKHGGVVAEAKDMDYELVAKPAVIQLHVRDHGKPADVSKASAKLTLMTGTEKQEVELKPAGDKFEATGSFKVGPGTKAVAVVTIAGKPTGTVRFALK